MRVDRLDHILSLVRGAVSDGGKTRWTDNELISLSSLVLYTYYADKKYPVYFEVSASEGTNSYSIPEYIGEVSAVERLYDTATVWEDITAASRVTREMGKGPVVEVAGFNGQLRVVWLEQNLIPGESVLLSADILDDDDELSVDTSLPMADSGYIHLGNEWIGYSYISTTSDQSTTLGGLTRGLFSTTPSQHSQGDPVWWGIASDRDDDMANLVNHIAFEAHASRVSNNTPTQTAGDYRAARMRMDLISNNPRSNNQEKRWRPLIIK